MKAHVSEEKKREVNLLKSLLKKYPVIGIVDTTNLPSPQLQKIRAQLKGKILIRIIKKRLIKLALEEIKNERDLIGLEKYLEKSMPGLLFTEEDPFKLFKLLKKNKTNAPARPGQISPKDIIILEGPTDFPPGPIIGEFGQVGIIAGVEGGKVVIKKEKLLVKAGEGIKPKIAEVLSKLGIKPMEIGLNVLAVYDKGTIFTKDVLDVDDDEYLRVLKEIYVNGLKLALSIGYITKDSIKFLMGKAFREADILDKKLKENSPQEKIKKDIVDIEKEAFNIKSKLRDSLDKLEGDKEEESQKVEKEFKQEKKVKEGVSDVDRKNILKADYSEEEAKKAQEIIDAIKDRDIRLKEQKKKSGGF